MNVSAFTDAVIKYRNLGYRFDAELAAMYYVLRTDERGQGRPCGKGWISRRKKCSKENKEYVAKNRQGDLKKAVAARQELRQLKRQARKRMTRPEIEAETAAKKVERGARETPKAKALREFKEETQRNRAKGQIRASKNPSLENFQPQKGQRFNIAGNLEKKTHGDWEVMNAKGGRVFLAKVKDGQVLPPKPKNTMTVDHDQLKAMMESGSAVLTKEAAPRKELPTSIPLTKEINRNQIDLRYKYAERDEYFRQNRYAKSTPMDKEIDELEARGEELAQEQAKWLESLKKGRASNRA